MLCLSSAAGMLTWGRTFLVHHLSGWPFAVYWVFCAILATGAVALAVVDIAIIRRRLRQERQELISKTFENIRNVPPK
jgi:hypothetical protein